MRAGRGFVIFWGVGFRGFEEVSRLKSILLQDKACLSPSISCSLRDIEYMLQEMSLAVVLVFRCGAMSTMEDRNV